MIRGFRIHLGSGRLLAGLFLLFLLVGLGSRPASRGWSDLAEVSSAIYPFGLDAG